MTGLLEAVRAIPLKEMDGTLLSVTIREEADQLGMDIPRVAHAIALAAYLHRNQTRKVRGLMPVTHYIEHPLRGALRYLRYGGTDENILVAILLHDTIEDCDQEIVTTLYAGFADHIKPETTRGLAFMWLSSTFGLDVEKLVRGVTNPLPDGVKRSQQEKRELYAEAVREKIQDPRIAMVKLVDFVDNALGLRHQEPLKNPGMVSHLSQKYLPLVPVFLSRVRKQDIQDLVSDEGYDHIIKQLTLAGSTLRQLSILR